LKPILDSLDKVWYTCEKSGDNNDFWQHEWERHGTCSGLSQLDFFQKTLTLYNQYVSSCPSGKMECAVCFTPQFDQEKCGDVGSSTVVV